MKKYMALLLTAVWAGVASAALYSYTETGSETIDGVTWLYCVSNNEARIVSGYTLSIGYASKSSYQYMLQYTSWLSLLRGSTPNSASHQCCYYHGTWSDEYCYMYYYSAISSSTTGAVAVPS